MKELNLCLHCGGSLATLEQVRQVKAPEPEGIWHPIAHGVLYNQVVSAMGSMNMRVVNERHALAKEGMRYFSLLQIGNCVEDKDYAFVIGLRGSLDKSYAAGISVGSGVFVCDNLAFSGEITIARKYTTNIERDLPVLASRAVGKLGASRIDMDKRIAAYKDTQVADSRANDVVIRALDVGAISLTRIPGVIAEWRKPSHEEFAPRTAWSLFNAFTETMKDTSIFGLPKRTQSLHALFDSECGIQTSITDGVADATVVMN
jgi:hypothetical protein